jgi:hypothetical protein
VQSTDDVVAFLRDQHNLIKDLFEEVLGASGTKAREAAFVDLRRLLAVDEIVDARLREEHAAKEQLAKLESMDVGASEFITELTAFRDAVLEHAEREETEEFTKLRRDLDASELRGLAAAVRAAEAIAPTRPHPGVESAKLNLAVGPFASMLDRARDAISAALR